MLEERKLKSLQTRSKLPAYFKFNDGGRKAAGYKGTAAGDCVVRAIAIASGKDYQEVYDAINEGCRTQRKTKRMHRETSARVGVYVKRKWYKDDLQSLGFRWVPTMHIGSGCQVHLRADELPSGRLVVHVSKHSTAVIDGVIHDTHDPSRAGTRCVYGYWIRG